MANALLDFVMSLVRDPDAAARYAADSAQAIKDANLTDVTPADVNGLIPVVSESLSAAVPTTGADASFGDELAGNVWTSGAATSAFDAFDGHIPDQALDDVPSITADFMDQPDSAVRSGLDSLADAGVPTITDGEDPSLQFDSPLIDDAPAAYPDSEAEWDQSLADVEKLGSDDSGFDFLG
ncbi:MAG: Rv0340 family IniB-related protein [Mycobacterium sp.]